MSEGERGVAVGSTLTFEQEAIRIRRVQLVYADVCARIARDDTHSWYVITVATLVPMLSAPLVRQMNGMVLVLCSIGVTMLLCAVGFGMVSLLAFRDLRSLPKGWLPVRRWILGDEGDQAVAQAEALTRRPSVFHTTSIRSHFEGVTPMSSEDSIEAARASYSERINARIADDFMDYALFLAHVVEGKKRPRRLALWALTVGTCVVVASLMSAAVLGAGLKAVP